LFVTVRLDELSARGGFLDRLFRQIAILVAV